MAVAGIQSSSVSLTAVGVSAPIVFNALRFSGSLEPSFLVILSSGASLTYSVEVTGDDWSAPGYNPATGNWVAFTNMSALTASAVGTLGAVVTAARLHVTAYTSGTATFQFVQQTAQ